MFGFFVDNMGAAGVDELFQGNSYLQLKTIWRYDGTR